MTNAEEYDIWGYDSRGHYYPQYDRLPFQSSPNPTCKKCDDGEYCADKETKQDA